MSKKKPTTSPTPEETVEVKGIKKGKMDKPKLRKLEK